MDTTKIIESVRQDLMRVAEVGDEALKSAAERLTYALEPSLRLAILDTLSEAAADLSDLLDGTVVDVRMQGREPSFVVSGQLPAPSPAPPPQSASPEADEAFEDGDAVTRITFRLPESLKVRAEALASQRGQSLNTWLVNAARAAAGGGEGPQDSGPGAPGRNRSSRRRIQGWVR